MRGEVRAGARGSVSDHTQRAGEPPVTAAWRRGDPPGRRRFLTLAAERPMALEGGGRLRGAEIAYETWGELGGDAANAVLVCHALSGDSHVHGPAGPGHPTDGWWEDLVGPGRGLDTDRWFVVCANVLGGCQGTTGPASPQPDDGRPWGSRFPVVTVRDMVRSQAALADHLGIGRWLSVIGGSMGGMQSLEWAVTYPDRVRTVAVVASTAAASAQQIAWSFVGRRAITSDPGFRGGEYYDAAPGEGPHRGLAVARAIAMIHYRSEIEFADRFGRSTRDTWTTFDLDQRFEVERYLDYQGEKLVRRFDANTYLVLNKAMDLHDIGRGRGGIARALDRIRVPMLTATVTTDALYPPYQQAVIRDHLRANGLEVEAVLIDSPNGHDGFLTDGDQLAGPLADFLTRHYEKASIVP